MGVGGGTSVARGINGDEHHDARLRSEPGSAPEVIASDEPAGNKQPSENVPAASSRGDECDSRWVPAEPAIAEVIDSEQSIELLATSEFLSLEWVGLIPDPDSFSKYPPYVQERICSWTDSVTLDESARQDRLINSEIRVAEWSTMITPILFLACVAGSVFLFHEGNNIGGSILLGPAALSILKSYLSNGRHKQRKSDEKDPKDQDPEG